MRGADNDVSPARPDSADPAGCPQVGVPRRAHRRGVGRRARRPVDRAPHRRRGHGRHDGCGRGPARGPVPRRRGHHPGAQCRRRAVGNGGRVADHQWAASRHHPSRPRPRPRVPPQAHARRADPARRRRRHQRVQLPVPGRPQGRRGGDRAVGDARCPDRPRLAARPRDGWLPRPVDPPRAEHASQGGARIVRRDGLLRPAVRRYRGAPHGGRGPARQRCGEPRHVALRGGQRRGDRDCRTSRSGVPADVVGAADRRRHRSRRHPRARRPRWSATERSRSARRSSCSSTCT